MCEAIIVCLSIASVIVRFRRASGLERLQLGWYVLWAILTALTFLSALAIFAFSSYIGNGLFALSAGMVIALPAVAGIAMIRHRLYDVDLVLNRTLVYGALSACVIGVYAGLVFGVGAIASGQGTVVAAAAAAVCALAAAPLRSRLQRGVNRLLYGARDEPVAAVTDLGAPARGDPRAGRRAADARRGRAARAAPALRRRRARHDRSATSPGAHVGEPRGVPLEISLLSQGETVGRLLLSPRRAGEELTQADRDVLEMLARQAGPAVQAVRLHADLQRSREQLVTAREEERRRLRRDLHDGLGPSLAGDRDAARRPPARWRTGPRPLRELLSGLEQQTLQALADIRRLVYDLRPPALDELGLVSALREQATSLQQPARHGRGRRALRRPAGRARGRRLPHRRRGDHERGQARRRDCLRCDPVDRDALELEVRDDGDGLPDTLHAGVGLTSMRERAAELGGTCTIANADGRRHDRACPPARARGGSMDPVRTLIADDHPVFRGGLRTLLGADELVEVVGEADERRARRSRWPRSCSPTSW